MSFVGHLNYWLVAVLMMVGLYMVMANANLIKKIIGLGVFQMGVFLLYISVGKVTGGSAPIASDAVTLYSNPLPHVLILTAIVVGVATTALALAIAVRIHQAYGSLEEDDINKADQEDLQ